MDALDHPEGRVGPLQLLAQQREADVVHAQAAVPLRDRRPQEAELAHLREDLAVDLAAGVPLPDVGQDLRLDEGAGGVADEPVLVGQGEVDHGEGLDSGSGMAPRCYPRPDAGRPVPVPGRRAPYTRSVDTNDAPASDALDLAALAGPNMSPVLGRYMDRSWSHGIGHRLYDTSGRAYLDFANGIAVTALGPRAPARDRGDPRPGRPAHGPGPRHRLRGVHGPARPDARGHLPGPAGHRPVPQLRLGGHRRRHQARASRDRPPGDHRVPGRVPRPDDRRHERDQLRRSTTAGATSRSCRRLPAPLPGRLPRLRRRRGGRHAGLPRVSSTTCSRRPSPPRRSPPSSSSPSRARAATTRPRPRSCRPLRAVCDEHGILLIADEVQSGFGRTGEMWAFEHAGIVPDVVCVAKAIANGLPLSAIVASRDVQAALGPRRPRHHVRRQPGGLRGRRRRARDDPRREPGRQRPRCAARSWPAACGS